LDWIGLGQDFQATLWIGLDWIHELMDWIGLGQQKWTHVQLWYSVVVRGCGMSITLHDRQRCVSVKLHLTQTNKRVMRQTDRRQETKLEHFSLKIDIWWQYFNDFPDNQLTKLRVFIIW